MAILSYFDLFKEESFENVKTTFHWSIFKDSLYYYKMVEEQNVAALGSYMLSNLEYMMNQKNHVIGVNPVSDIYLLDQQLIGYRSKIVEGASLEHFSKKAGYDFEKWISFFQNLIGILNQSSLKGYIFPDLFSNGNILISEDGMNIHLIDNDGIQIHNRFVGYYDKFAEKIIINSFSNPSDIILKYFDLQEECFTNQYTILSLYACFFDYFFQIDLISLLQTQDYSNFLEFLKIHRFPIHSGFVYACMNLFSLEQNHNVNEQDFLDILKLYSISSDGDKRTLIPR